jgi:DNA-binding LacI/PurR family transcriptional regulator
VITLFDDPKARVIDLDHVKAATELVEHYLNERIRIRGMAQPDQELLRAQELLKWLRDKGLKRVCLPDVYQYGPSKLRTAQQAKDTVNVLVNHYYLIHREGKHKSEIDGKTARESWIIR